MTSMTSTRSQTFDLTELREGGIPALGWDYRSFAEFYRLISRVDMVAQWDSPIGRARRIWNEAVRENDHRTALAEAPVLLTLAPVEYHGEVDRLTREAVLLRATIDRLSAPVTEGSDPRLEEFWGLAAEAADREGFCPEYDRIARAMGGTARQHTFTVDLEITVRVSVEVEATSNAEARDYASDYDLSDLDQIVRDNVDVNRGDVEVVGSSRA